MEKINEKLEEAASQIEAVLKNIPVISDNLRKGRIEEMISLLEVDAAAKLEMAKARIENVIGVNKKFADVMKEEFD